MQIGGLGSEVWLGTLLARMDARTTSVPFECAVRVTSSYKVLIVAEDIIAVL